MKWAGLVVTLSILLAAVYCFLLSSTTASPENSEGPLPTAQLGGRQESFTTKTNAIEESFSALSSAALTNGVSDGTESADESGTSVTTKEASPGIDDETAESICRSHLKTRVKDPSCELESIQRSPGRILVLLRKKSVSETGYGAVFHVQLDSETGAVVDDAVEIRENR